SIYNIIIFISITVYSSLAFVLLTKHRKRLKEHFTYKSGRNTLNWLLFVSITVYVSFCLTFLSSGVKLFVNVPFDPKIFTYVGLTLISFAFSFYGYRQASIFSHNQPAIPKLNEEEKQPRKYAKSLMSNEEMNEVLRKLEISMQTDHLFLRAELDLAEISRHLKIPKHHITQTINTLTNKNLYTFINEYRVQEFENRIHNTENQNFTILAVAMDCGFNSKSTFNSVYKKITGHTPTDYLKKKPK
ncbi:MAG: helix-turn-helix transcriptional regulator, partial [Bacteroidales bacterium]|nr:helix-turn-helix transcriptional regulator [Bacteroidales bacterium]